MNNEHIDEAFLRTAYVLHSHWKVSNETEKLSLQCGGHSRLFEVLIPDNYIIKGESLKGKGRREHVVPCALIRCHAYSMFNNGDSIEKVADMIRNNLIIIHITKEEQVKLDVQLRLKTTMPKTWEFGQDPYIRLTMANIEFKFYDS
jgi:hypothetical protein